MLAFIQSISEVQATLHYSNIPGVTVQHGVRQEKTQQIRGYPISNLEIPAYPVGATAQRLTQEEISMCLSSHRERGRLSWGKMEL